MRDMRCRAPVVAILCRHVLIAVDLDESPSAAGQSKIRDTRDRPDAAAERSIRPASLVGQVQHNAARIPVELPQARASEDDPALRAPAPFLPLLSSAH